MADSLLPRLMHLHQRLQRSPRLCLRLERETHVSLRRIGIAREIVMRSPGHLREQGVEAERLCSQQATDAGHVLRTGFSRHVPHRFRHIGDVRAIAGE
ncbi:hypothetical protein [Sphingomonas sp. DC2300-3]|uniref:hypothetical protein n=1 Tax=unclassified Sphingomonas TaxID=196159 RepID=UPI003CF7242D